MQVRLVSITPDAEKQIIYIARVSNPENQNNPNIAGLVKHLIRNGHWSPFEHAVATFEIVTSRAISTQMLRHHSFRFQEFSQRYSTVTEFESIELRKQAEKNRQSSTDVFNPVLDPGMDVKIYANDIIQDQISDAYNVYKKLLGLGVAKESARFILPLATQTTLYMTGFIRNWIHYLGLRNDEHTQKEHQLIAIEIENILRRELPTIFEALDMIKAEKENHQQMIRVLLNHGLKNPGDLLAALLNSPVGQLQVPSYNASVGS